MADTPRQDRGFTQPEVPSLDGRWDGAHVDDLQPIRRFDGLCSGILWASAPDLCGNGLRHQNLFSEELKKVHKARVGQEDEG